MNFSVDTQALHSFSFLIFRKSFPAHNLERLHLSTVISFTYLTLDLTRLSCTQQYPYNLQKTDTILSCFFSYVCWLASGYE